MASYSLKYIDCIPLEDKNIVFGYIRRCQALLFAINNNSYYSIPDIVNYLILFYFYVPSEYFTVHGDHLKILDKDNKITSHLKSINL